MRLTHSTVESAPTLGTRSEHLERLERQAGSNLEKRWLAFIERNGHRLPSHAQRLFAEAGTRPDFFYGNGYGAAIYVDGPHHDYPERKARDAAKEEAMEDLGYMVIRFGHQDDWQEIVSHYPYVFGGSQLSSSATYRATPHGEPDLDLFAPEWHPLVEALASLEGVEVEGGTDISDGTSLVGQSVAEVLRDGKTVMVVNGSESQARRLFELISASGGRAVIADPESVEETVAAIVRIMER